MTLRLWWVGSTDPAHVPVWPLTALSTRPAAPRPMPTFPGHYDEDEDV